MRRGLTCLLCLFCLLLSPLSAQDHEHDHDHDHGQETSEPETVPGEEPKAKIGDMAEVYYMMHVDVDITDGPLNRDKDKFLDATKPGKPFKFQIGQPRVIPGFSIAVVGMRPGEKKHATITPKMGFGDLQPALKDAYIFLDVEMVSLQPEVKSDEDDHDHGHESRANLPAIMDFMLKAFFRQAWMPRTEDEDEPNPDPTRAVLGEALRTTGFAVILLVFGLYQEKKRRS